MKKLEIKNPKWRMVVGIPIFLGIVVIAVLFFYVVGWLAVPDWQAIDRMTDVDNKSFAITAVAGFYTLLIIALFWIIVFGAIYGFIKGSKWAGNFVCNNNKKVCQTKI